MLFCHFTDSRNIPFIRKNGILAATELTRLGIVPPARGGNQLSQELDARCGMDGYVHLCFTDNHPMAHVALQQNRIVECVYLSIDPSIILQAGVLVTLDVSNKNDVIPMAPAYALDRIDHEVLYTRTDWNDPKINERLKAAEKCELLVPNRVAAEMIRFPAWLK